MDCSRRPEKMAINQGDVLKLVTAKWQSTKAITLQAPYLTRQTNVSRKLSKLMQWGFVERRLKISDPKFMYDWRLKTKA